MNDFFKQSRVRRDKCLYYPALTSSVRDFYVDRRLTHDETDAFLAQGWRHFSAFFFCDDCRDCLLCQPLRVRVNDFLPSRSQRRVLRKNSDISIKFLKLEDFAKDSFVDGYLVYKKFLEQRYKKEAPSLSQYLHQFFSSPVESVVSAFYFDGRLVGTGFLDVGGCSVSTLYFAFDPDYSERSLGTFSIVKELEWAAISGYDYYYLGYYIAGKSEMMYKARFRPYELYDFQEGVWQA